jgi:hypothetical protein
MHFFTWAPSFHAILLQPSDRSTVLTVSKLPAPAESASAPELHETSTRIFIPNFERRVTRAEVPPAPGPGAVSDDAIRRESCSKCLVGAAGIEPATLGLEMQVTSSFQGITRNFEVCSTPVFMRAWNMSPQQMYGLVRESPQSFLTTIQRETNFADGLASGALRLSKKRLLSIVGWV